MKKININLWRGTGLSYKESMKSRTILDKFTKRQYKKLDFMPKYIDDNFMRLFYWITEKKQFNKNTLKVRKRFWQDLKNICKKHKINYNEVEVKEK